MGIAEARARNARERAAGVVHVHADAPARPPAPVPLPVLAPCAHGGTDADIVERCPTCGNGGGRHVRECEVYGKVIWEPQPDMRPAMTCRQCQTEGLGYAPEPPAPGAGVVIDHGAGGIGDGLLGLTVVAHLSATQPAPVEYRVSAAARPFVALFDGYATLGTHARAHSEQPVPAARQVNVGYSAEARDRFPVPRWMRYARNIGTAGHRIPDLREPERVRALGADFAGAVALLPFSTDRSREWSVHHWLTLESELIARGYRTVALHDAANPLALFRGAKLAGAPADRVAGVLLNACCAVGSDSGLSHLAGILGAPTVVLGGSTPVAQIFGHYPRMTCIQGGLACSGCCGGTGVAVGGPFEERCRASCSNLQSIAPARVLAEVDRVWLKEALAAGRSLLTADRLAVIRDEVRRTNGLAGDAAELGTFQGGSAKVIRHYAAGALHLFDTFAGIPESDLAEGGHHVRGEFAGALDEVRAFVGTGLVEYHAGTFPDALPADGTRYRFVHLDGDTYQTTAAALAYFAPRMVAGGVIVLDDFGWVACPGVGRACHEAGFRPERTTENQAVIRF